VPIFRATFLTRLAVIVIVLALAWTRVSESATLTLAWDQSTDPNVAGYVLSWGTQSGVYGSQANVGNQSLVQVGGLADGTNYYFVVSAYNAAGQLSLPSAEVSGPTPMTATNAPSVSCTAPTASSLDGNPVIVKFAPVVAGGLAPVTTTCSPASGSLFPVGSTSLTCSAVDALQRSASCSTVVTVSGPPPPPTITCPIPTATSPYGDPVVVNFAPTVSGGAPPAGASCLPVSGSLFPVGTTSLTCNVVDALKRVASCTGSVVVSGQQSTGKGRGKSKKH
jgi:Fibronectin type III domain